MKTITALTRALILSGCATTKTREEIRSEIGQMKEAYGPNWDTWPEGVKAKAEELLGE